MKEAKRTPTPWKVDENNELPLGIIRDDENGMGIIEFDQGIEYPYDPTDAANAAFIVQACNVHDELVEILKGTRACLVLGGFSTAPVDAVLARAGEK